MQMNDVKMNGMKRTTWIIVAMLSVALSSCGIYSLSFSGTSIEPDVNTIEIGFFGYKAEKVNPNLSNDMTEALRSQFRRMTRLEQVDQDGDLVITGDITSYEFSTQAVSAEEKAARNKLTISASVTFENVKHPDSNFSKKSFSAYEDYDADRTIEEVESTLCKQIIDKIVEEIFNATVAQW